MKTIKLLLAAIAITLTQLAWAGPVNVNSADAETLAKELVGVGPKIAAAIVAERANSDFKDGQDLVERIKGLGEKFLENNQDNLLFSG